MHVQNLALINSNLKLHSSAKASFSLLLILHDLDLDIQEVRGAEGPQEPPDCGPLPLPCHPLINNHLNHPPPGPRAPALVSVLCLRGKVYVNLLKR